MAVAYDPEKGFEILIPDNEEADIPDKAVALIAAAVRLGEDMDFCNEMLRWFEERQRE